MAEAAVVAGCGRRDHPLHHAVRELRGTPTGRLVRGTTGDRDVGADVESSGCRVEAVPMISSPALRVRHREPVVGQADHEELGHRIVGVRNVGHGLGEAAGRPSVIASSSPAMLPKWV